MPKTLAPKPPALTPLAELDAVRGPTERIAQITEQIEALERERIALEVRHSNRLEAIAEAIAKGLPEPAETPAELRSVDEKLTILRLARGKAYDDREAAMRAACYAALEATRGRRLELARDIEAALEALESAESEAVEFHDELERLGYAPHLVGSTRFTSFGLRRVRDRLQDLGRSIAEFQAGSGN
jgi:chromosome segregation ATPase